MKTILCSAVHYRNGKKYSSHPTNKPLGLVVCGRRHNDCFVVLKQIKDYDESLVEHDDLGFVTSDNLFLTRKEAWIVAKEANQIFGPNREDELNILTSEDLYWGNDK